MSPSKTKLFTVSNGQLLNVQCPSNTKRQLLFFLSDFNIPPILVLWPSFSSVLHYVVSLLAVG